MFKLTASVVQGKMVNGTIVQLGWWNASDAMHQKLRDEMGRKLIIQPDQTKKQDESAGWKHEWVYVKTKDFLDRPDLMPYWRHMQQSWRGNVVKRPYDYIVR